MSATKKQLSMSEYFNINYNPFDSLRTDEFKYKLIEIVVKATSNSTSDVDVSIDQIISCGRSFYRTPLDCSKFVFPALLESLPVCVSDDEYLIHFKRLITEWKRLFQIFFPIEDQYELLLSLQYFALTHHQGLQLKSLIDKVIPFLYMEDLVGEDALFVWEKILFRGTYNKPLHTKLVEFLEVLRESKKLNIKK